jgi:hypothetical protein
MGQLRSLFGDGLVYLEDDDCERLCVLLDNMRFKPTKPRDVRLTSVHADAIRSKAREVGWFSMALAQAFQFELLMFQKDVIGEWLPAAEATGPVECQWDGDVWSGGLRWEEIDENFVLRHPTTTRERSNEERTCTHYNYCDCPLRLCR